MCSKFYQLGFKRKIINSKKRKEFFSRAIIHKNKVWRASYMFILSQPLFRKAKFLLLNNNVTLVKTEDSIQYLIHCRLTVNSRP